MPLSHLSMQNSLRIGLLATGNELTEGDILNTNGQNIARLLVEEGLSIGMHAMTSDAQEDIAQALKFLLSHHNCIIITGGLGPTSDDCTRHALSNVINKPLVFDDNSWEHFLERFNRLGTGRQPDTSNRQQALFPEGAEILINVNGSANGCKVIFEGKFIYMLPGPPRECLPMFEQLILPELLTFRITHLQKFKWRLLAAVESEIATKVDEVTKNFPVMTGYRVDQPYLEVKVYSDQASLPITLIENLNNIFKPHTIDSSNKSASNLLREAIESFPDLIIINDKATHGALQVALMTANTYHKLLFSSEINKNALQITFNGLTEFWKGQKPGGYVEIEIGFKYRNIQEIDKITVPYWNAMVLKYAVEFISRRILLFIRNI